MAAGVILAVLAAGLVWLLGESSRRTALALVATRDVPPLTRLAPADVALRPVPAQALPRDALRSAGQASGRFVRYGLLSGQVVRLANLAASAAGAGRFDEQLTAAARGPGAADLRAVTLALTPQAGLVLPRAGDRVDVVAVVRAGQLRQARVIASRVRVLDRLLIGAPSGPGRGGSGGSGSAASAIRARQGIVVLALTLAQAEQVALAQAVGSVGVVLDPLGVGPGPTPAPFDSDAWGVPPAGARVPAGGGAK
jgi:Flp pilus assembly protein CpaB